MACKSKLKSIVLLLLDRGAAVDLADKEVASMPAHAETEIAVFLQMECICVYMSLYILPVCVCIDTLYFTYRMGEVHLS